MPPNGWRPTTAPVDAAIEVDVAGAELAAREREVRRRAREDAGGETVLRAVRELERVLEGLHGERTRAAGRRALRARRGGRAVRSAKIAGATKKPSRRPASHSRIARPSGAASAHASRNRSTARRFDERADRVPRILGRADAERERGVGETRGGARQRRRRRSIAKPRSTSVPGSRTPTRASRGSPRRDRRRRRRSSRSCRPSRRRRA